MIKFKLAYGETACLRFLLLVAYTILIFLICYVFVFMFRKEMIGATSLAIVFAFAFLAFSIISFVVRLIGLLVCKPKVFIENNELKYQKHIINLNSIKRITFDMGNIRKRGSYPSILKIHCKYKQVITINRAPVRLYLYLKENCKFTRFEFLNYKELTVFNPIFYSALGLVFALMFIFLH